jgi:hypothetical protein
MNTRKFLISCAVLLLVSFMASAQVSGDSLHSLKQQKQSLELSKKINDNKMKLAKLENTLEKKTMEMEKTTTEAQRAADDNAEAAAKLSNDSQDKKRARQAETAADNAKKSAKRARVAGDNLTQLKEEIRTLKNKITDDEAKLAFNPLIIPAQ